MALKLNQDDIASHFRTAVVLIEEGRFSQAETCLDAGERLLPKLSPSAEQDWLGKLKAQRCKLSRLKPCYINSLPNEILVRIAQFLGVGGRLTMSQTCNTWRDVILTPSLWYELVIDIKSGPRTSTSLTAKQAAKWFDHIRICASKSGNALRTVRFGGPFPDQMLVPVLTVLRRSAHSLVRIDLPAVDQERCYSLLYRYCPNLTTLNVKRVKTIQVDDVRSIHLKIKGGLVRDSPEVVDVPFLLESFTGDHNIQHPGLAKHLLCLRVLDNYNPFTPITKRAEAVPGQVLTPIEQQHEEPWPRIADSLEEWRVGVHWPSRQLLSAAAQQESHLRPWNRTLPIKLTFPKLTRLESFRLNRNLRFEFPQLRQLLHLRIGTEMDHDFWSEEFGRILSTSPLLEKIVVKLFGRHFIQNDWVQALRGLQNLEELSLASANPAITLLLLMPIGIEDSDGQRRVEVPLPKLKRLTLAGWLPDSKKLAKILLMRKRLRDGMSLFEAREWVLHHLEPVIHHMRSPAFEEVRTEDVGLPWPYLTKEQEDPSLKVSDPERCSSLEVLELTKVGELSPSYEELRTIVPKLIIKFALK